jgi:hypothetical protein
MKTFWLMIGGSAVLTVVMIFVGMYRISKSDSTSQPQNPPQVQKQHISKNTPTNETPSELASETPAKSVPVAMPSVAVVKPGTVMNKASHRESAVVKAQSYNGNVIFEICTFIFELK